MNILILAAGGFNKLIHDGEFPPLLTEINGITLIEHVLNSVKKLNANKIIVALRQSEVARFHLNSVIHMLDKNIDIIEIKDGVKGAACTALIASTKFNEEEVLILNANQLVDVDLSEAISSFKQRKLGAGVVVFNSVHPRYSYVLLNESNNIIEAVEGRPISNCASAGIFWFGKKQQLVDSIKEMIRKDAAVNGAFYITPVLNELILKQVVIGTYKIDNSKYRPIKTEKQLTAIEVAYEGTIR